MNQTNSKKLTIVMALVTASLFSTIANASAVDLATALRTPGVYKKVNNKGYLNSNAKYIKQNQPVSIDTPIYAVANGCIARATGAAAAPPVWPLFGAVKTNPPSAADGRYSVQCSNNATTGKFVRYRDEWVSTNVYPPREPSLVPIQGPHFKVADRRISYRM